MYLITFTEIVAQVKAEVAALSKDAKQLITSETIDSNLSFEEYKCIFLQFTDLDEEMRG